MFPGAPGAVGLIPVNAPIRSPWLTDAMSEDLLAKYDGAVPRYTSYPTAPHFSAAVDARTYESWLDALDAGHGVSLYLHVPFCRRMCWFCGCHTKITRRDEPIARYARHLESELALVRTALGARFRVDHVHWGGGTPSVLTAADFAALSDAVDRAFTGYGAAEVTVEIDPRTLDRDRVAALAAAGVNRASLGVQDLDPAVQQRINRIQPYAVTARALDWLRGAGITRLNLDLMYGLPGQTVAGVADTAERVAALEPGRIALFGYAHVPWMKRHQRLIDEAALPGRGERLAQFEAAAERLLARGYVRIGLDHFARPDDPLARAAATGALHRNFQGYTTDEAAVLLGLGASAIGSLPQGYVQNRAPIGDWQRAVAAGRFAVARGIALDDDDRRRCRLIERLMCDLAVDLDGVAGQGEDFAPERSRLGPMVEDGLVRIDGERLEVTEAGRPLLRTVCAVFDRYLESGTGRHSRAV